MAEKQFARNEADKFAALAEDDPLSELARIVGYDARPAVETLKELKRHQETVKIDPPFNLEEELLREFDRYAGDESPAPIVEPSHAPVAARAEPSFAPAPAFIAEPELAAAPAPTADPSDVFDLARELELSMRAETTASPAFDEEPVFNAPAFDMSVFDDVAIDAEPEPVAVAPAEQRRSVPVEGAPVANRVEPSFEQPISFTAARPEVVAPPSPAASAEPDISEVDKLLADVARFPVPPAPVRASAAAAVQAEPAQPGRKQNYPFTPVFSRATPVAGASGARSYATPAPAEMPVETPRAPLAAAAAPLAAPVAAEAFAPSLPEPDIAPTSASEAEPDFDLANFEQELSAIQFDFDSLDEPLDGFDASVVSQDRPDVVQEPRREEPAAFAEPFVPEETLDEQLPFDPSMIAETDEHPAPIAEMDVPALPVHEEPAPVVPQHVDFDLDLDAEMAQLFAEHQSAPVSRAATGSEAIEATAAFAPFAKAAPAATSLDLQIDEDLRRAFEAQRAQFGQAPQRGDAFSFETDSDVTPLHVEKERSRLPIYAAAAAILLLLGGVGVYAWMGGSDAALTAEGPKVILADKDPVKVVPEEKGGKTVPNQDKAVYDRVAGTQDEAPRQDALVSTKEEPLDVVQRTLTPETLPLPDEEDGGAATADAAPDGADSRLLPEGQAPTDVAKDEQSPAVAPRKVRTMIVKPDGTLVAREETVAEPATPALATQPATTATTPASTGAEVALAQPTTDGAATTTAATPNATDTAATDAAATQAAATAPAATTTPVVDTPVNTPVPQMRPAEQPVNVVGTVTENGNLRPTAAAEQQVAAATPSQAATAAAANATVAPGTYVIQIASVPSEADAQKTYNNLSSKFGSVIGGRGVDIKRADIQGKGTFYRVRVPVGSKEEANQLCARYKSAGGSCLVTR